MLFVSSPTISLDQKQCCVLSGIGVNAIGAGGSTTNALAWECWVHFGTGLLGTMGVVPHWLGKVGLTSEVWKCVLEWCDVGNQCHLPENQATASNGLTMCE